MRNVRSSMKTSSRIVGPRASSGEAGIGAHGKKQREESAGTVVPAPSGSQQLYTPHQLGMCQGPVRGEQTVRRWDAETVEDQLSVVRCIKSLFAGDVPRDEQVGVHLRQERSYILRTRVAAPYQGMD